MTVQSTFNARDASVYEMTMGRWSRRLAPGFAAFAGLAPGERVLDVGCGPGSLLLHLAGRPERPVLTAIDASPIYVEAARAKAADCPGDIMIEVGDACAMRFPDGAFDRALSQLVLQFIPDSKRAAAEMARVTRPGGTVAAAVWASGGGMVAQRMFMETAAAIDPAGQKLRDHTFTRPMTRRGELAALWHAVGLRDVVEDWITIWMEHPDFSDYWEPIAAGEGTLGRYVTAMEPGLRERLRDALRLAYLCGEPDGARAFAATALVCRGVKTGGVKTGGVKTGGVKTGGVKPG